MQGFTSDGVRDMNGAPKDAAKPTDPRVHMVRVTPRGIEFAIQYRDVWYRVK